MRSYILSLQLYRRAYFARHTTTIAGRCCEKNLLAKFVLIFYLFALAACNIEFLTTCIGHGICTLFVLLYNDLAFAKIVSWTIITKPLLLYRSLCAWAIVCVCVRVCARMHMCACARVRLCASVNLYEFLKNYIVIARLSTWPLRHADTR